MLVPPLGCESEIWVPKKQSKQSEEKMKTKKRYLVGLLAAVNVVSVFAAGTVMAAEGGEKMNYGQLKVGMIQPSGDQDDAGFDTGGDFSAAYGRHLNKFLVVEGAIDLFGSGQDSSGYNSHAGYYDQDTTLSGAAFLVTLKGEFSSGPVDLFAGAGVGLYSVLLDSEIDSSRFGDVDAEDSDGVFGAHVVAGLNYNINDRFFVGMEGRYRWTDDVELSDTVASIPVEYYGDLSGFVVTFNGGIRF